MILLNYKNNLIKVKPSRITHFWFELCINGVSQGDYRSIESAIEYGKYIIDSALDKLKSIDQTTIIDNVWEDYLKADLELLNSLKLITGYESYAEILTMFEGFSIENLLKYFK
jgi:hypothetical protein